MRVSIISSIKLKSKKNNNLLYLKKNFNNDSYTNNINHQINNIKYVLLKGIKKKKEDINKIILSTHYIGNIDSENFGMTSSSSIYNNFNYKEKLNLTKNKKITKKNLSSINLSNLYLNKFNENNKNKNQSKNKNEITEYKKINKNYSFKKINIPLIEKKIFFEFFNFHHQITNEKIFLKTLSNYYNKKIFFKKKLETKRFIDKNYQEFINEKKLEKKLKNKHNSVYKNILTKKNIYEKKSEENKIKNIKPNNEFLIKSNSYKKLFVLKIQQINERNNYQINMKTLTSKK